jgi:hypothetical protein
MAFDNATWEQLPNFKEVYPDVQLEDELFAEVGREVMWGKTFNRRAKMASTANQESG